MRTMRARLGEERGFGLASSIIVLGILIALSLPLLSLVDMQQAQSTTERKSESSFNLAEAALDASVFVLGKRWPAVAGSYPPACTHASTSLACPSADMLAASYAGGDYTNRAWSVQISDDTGAEYYNPAAVPPPPNYDANKNGRVWVRADARAADGERSVVVLVRRIDRTEPFPRNALTAGWFVITTGGMKVVVDTKGDTAQAAPLAVRCAEPAPSLNCLEYRPEQGQVSPDTSTVGYAADTVMAPEALERMRDKAKTLGTYHPSGCPLSPEGELVFVEVGNCDYAGGGSANTREAPGMFIVGDGTLMFGGGMTYYGMVYAANLQRTTGEIITVHGAATVVGSIAADAGGGVRLGSNGFQLIYDDAVFPLITSFSAAAPVQGSWRELPSS